MGNVALLLWDMPYWHIMLWTEQPRDQPLHSTDTCHFTLIKVHFIFSNLSQFSYHPTPSYSCLSPHCAAWPVCLEYERPIHWPIRPRSTVTSFIYKSHNIGDISFIIWNRLGVGGLYPPGARATLSLTYVIAAYRRSACLLVSSNGQNQQWLAVFCCLGWLAWLHVPYSGYCCCITLCRALPGPWSANCLSTGIKKDETLNVKHVNFSFQCCRVLLVATCVPVTVTEV